MIKEALLIGAITFAPVTIMADTTIPVVETPATPVDETTPTDTTTATQNKDGWTYITDFLSEFITPQVLASIISVIAQISIVLNLVSSLRKLAQSKQTTLGDVKTAILTDLKGVVSEEVATQIEKVLNEKLNMVADSTEKVSEVLDIFAKILLLSQAPSKENQLAIIDLIGKLGVVDKKVTDTQKANVELQAKEEEAKKIATQEAVNKVIDTTKPTDTTNLPDGTRI